MAQRKRSSQKPPEAERRTAAAAAQNLLNDPTFKGAIQGVKNDILADIEKCGVNQQPQILGYHSELKVLERIKARLQRAVNEGSRLELAQQQASSALNKALSGDAE